MWFTWFCVAVGVCHLLLAFLLTWNRRRTPLLGAAAPPLDPQTAPSVLAVVPARNEENNIEDCVRSLLAQDYPNLQVRVVDDHSTDRTAELVARLAAQDPRLKLLHAPTLPPGWLGKPHALHAGTREAATDYLVFVDADLRAGRDAVRRSVAMAEQQQAGLLTAVPTLVAEGFWERAAQPVVGMLLFSLLDPVKVRDPKSEVAAAYGPYMFFRRTAYEQIGGHTAVAREVIEDLRLAELVKRAGLRFCYAHGTDSLRLRMYDSLRALIGGWRKNFHAALGKAQWFAPVGAALIVTIFGFPTLAALGAVLAYAVSGGAADAQPALLAGLFCYGADWVGRLTLRRQFGITWRGVRSLGGLVVAYILCSSSYSAVTGKPVTWRGRAIGKDGSLSQPS